MKRIAYASPVNPAPSGISDYSEELLPYLAQYADVTVYIDDALKPTNAQLKQHLVVRPVSKLARDHKRQPYDAILYHMGNSPAHAGIWTAMQRTPGVLVLHDAVLHHFVLNYAALVQKDIGWYQAEAARRYGAEGERIARLMLHGRFSEAAFTLPFSEHIVAAAQGVIAHSCYVLDHVAGLLPELPAALVPMGVPLPPLIDRDEARARLDLPRDALILASFGHINPYKRIDSVLRALHTLRDEYDARYVLVGSVSPNYPLHSIVARAGLENVVRVTGYVDRAAFEDYVAAADICVNLRHPTAGETSASLLRLLGAGKPTLVTASGSFTELPANVAAQVDHDASEGDLILGYCYMLAGRPDLAAQLSASARAFVAREHTLDGAAQGYMRFLSQLYGWGDVRKERGLLWEPTTDDRRPTTDSRAKETRKGGGKNQEPRTEHQEPSTARDSSVLSAQSSVLSPHVAEAVLGIGATEDDTRLLQSVARALNLLQK